VITEKGIHAMSTKDGLLMCKHPSPPGLLPANINCEASPGGGASAVFGCDGRLLTAPLGPAEEGIVYADIDFDQAVFARSFLDVCGHYSRPDLLWLGADTRERKLKIEHPKEVEEVPRETIVSLK
jgi:hypothetical protein